MEYKPPRYPGSTSHARIQHLLRLHRVLRAPLNELGGEMTKTILLREVSCGTELEIVLGGLPEQLPLEMCYLGWQESLLPLVEHHIPGNE